MTTTLSQTGKIAVLSAVPSASARTAAAAVLTRRDTSRGTLTDAQGVTDDVQLSIWVKSRDDRLISAALSRWT